MKALLICASLVAVCFIEKKGNRSYTLVKPGVQAISKDSIPTDTNMIDFNTAVKPIFVSHCSPCHFSGGKMYERLPFDKDTTIIAHEQGILRRIKDEKNKELISQFIQQQNK